eukprot:CAMPEP_0181250688 /NCGR_PEP_ID=MMETSP1096-20121128/46454_1 /TAXON_ID=156174 ORGANISM="Chrysochromulina ericina, Strain CCMP281" /NCGR_SAMPLE_ID=MMETSP1096 /ASSEMBLY_ACC=CAM_ASM_000453 /LENGTH=36 /DNA_ID= /DNA_START= /DNA_END= /DNA_ORIENTATION=
MQDGDTVGCGWDGMWNVGWEMEWERDIRGLRGLRFR